MKIAGIIAHSLSLRYLNARRLSSARPETAARRARNVVLVHGAWADGSSWAEVIPLLQAAGLNVTAVQNPLTSLADSVAATRRALALQDGPTVLVAHSWGGTVISETGTDPKVTALVYVAARAPDAAEDFVALSGKFPTMPVRAGVQEHDGFTNLSEEAFLKYFANGVEPKAAEVLYAVQEPTAASSVRRTNHGGRLALQTLMVCGVEARSDHQSRPRAISGKAHECDNGGAGGRPPVAGVASQTSGRPDPGRGGSGKVAVILATAPPPSGARCLATSIQPFAPSASCCVGRHGLRRGLGRYGTGRLWLTAPRAGLPHAAASALQAAADCRCRLGGGAGGQRRLGLRRHVVAPLSASARGVRLATLRNIARRPRRASDTC